jgi:1-acyl-sn-glycerol-3-phosphate acyltransferase
MRLTTIRLATIRFATMQFTSFRSTTIRFATVRLTTIRLTTLRLTNRFVLFLIFVFLRLTCKIDGDEIKSVPKQGPMILLINHINFLDTPVMYSYLQPRKLTALVKTETWDNPIMGALFSLWGGIPIQRGTIDRQAFKQVENALKDGFMVALAPEGTRSGTGRLQEGHSGVVYLALRSGAPLLPLVFYGGENFWDNLRHFRKTDFHIRVGKPFYLNGDTARIARDLRQQMTTEIMYQIASLLPPEYRGEYDHLESASQDYIIFNQDNLPAGQ